MIMILRQAQQGKNRFGKNIQFLRKRKKRSQEEVALALEMKRSTLSGYESGIARPTYERLIAMSDYFKISIDHLIKENIDKLGEQRLRELEMAIDLEGKRIRILTSSVDSSNEEQIELVSEKAKAGYQTGYADPEYISVLPTFSLPFLSKQRKYRSFPISGDSMPPVNHGSYVTGEYVQNWKLIKSGTPYIIVTKNEGIVFKNVDNQIEEKGSLLLSSTNPVYQPYEVKVQDIIEVWKFVNYISPEMPTPDLSNEQISEALLHLQRDVSKLRNEWKR
jgi:transcriptional regulator with XRE-family HTH domain